MPKEELRGRVGLIRRGPVVGASETRLFGGILARMATDGVVVDEGTGVRRADHEVVLDGQVRALADELLGALRVSPFAPPTLQEVRAAQSGPAQSIDDDIVAALVREAAIVRVTDDLLFTRDAHDEMGRRVVGHLERHGSITVAEARDLIGTSRKYVLPFLEFLDRERYTRRVGDVRHFGSRPVPPGWAIAPHDAAPAHDASGADDPQ